jgi:hypothetical protein
MNVKFFWLLLKNIRNVTFVRKKIFFFILLAINHNRPWSIDSQWTQSTSVHWFDCPTKQICMDLQISHWTYQSTASQIFHCHWLPIELVHSQPCISIFIYLEEWYLQLIVNNMSMIIFSVCIHSGLFGYYSNIIHVIDIRISWILFEYHEYHEYHNRSCQKRERSALTFFFKTIEKHTYM